MVHSGSIAKLFWCQALFNPWYSTRKALNCITMPAHLHTSRVWSIGSGGAEVTNARPRESGACRHRIVPPHR